MNRELFDVSERTIVEERAGRIEGRSPKILNREGPVHDTHRRLVDPILAYVTHHPHDFAPDVALAPRVRDPRSNRKVGFSPELSCTANRHELFRRMVFNALISNTDDHPRNHALIAPEREWILAPAYDLTPNPMYAVERRDLALVCGRFGRAARRDNLLSHAPRFGLAPSEANDVVDEIKRLIQAEWRETVRSAGGNDTDLRIIERAFTYEGFEYVTGE